MCGWERLSVGGQTYWLRPPTPVQRYLAAEAYADALDDAGGRGLLTEAEAAEASGWRGEDDAALAKYEKDTEDFLVRLYEVAARAKEREAVRTLLKAARLARNTLLQKRHALDHATAPGHARACRARYDAGSRLTHADRSTPVWPGDAFSDDASSLVAAAAAAHAAARLSESQTRELARTDPWRTVWACRHSEGSVFGRPAAELTDDQRALTAWSRLYDNAAEDPDPPNDAAVADDDLFDGWLVVRRRAREGRGKESRVAGVSGNGKIDSAGEVYFVGGEAGFDPEELAEIAALNGPQGVGVQREREAAVRRAGSLEEFQLPDVGREVGMALNRLAAGRTS